MPLHDPALIARTAELARGYLERLPDAAVGAVADQAALTLALGGELPAAGAPPLEVIEALARAVEPGLVASAGPRFFGFVTGGCLPAALAAEWLTATWDQNAVMYVHAPAAAVVEAIVARWLLDLFGLPASASVGLVTGGQMANFVALAAARHAVLARIGWDLERDGLAGAPPLRVVAGAEAHATIAGALRFLGIGAAQVTAVATDARGRTRPAALAAALAATPPGPTIVCAQLGNVNGGGCDPVRELAALARARGAWLHVDGAFGLWAAASPRHRHLADGVELADSWATDAHKWLNVAYDSGVVAVADPAAHRAAMSVRAAYLAPATGGERDGFDWAPEASRRARGFAIYAALRSLGRAGLAGLIERSCDLAARFAAGLARAGVAEVLGAELNQAVVRFPPPAGSDADGFTRAVIARVQGEGTCWLGGTSWRGVAAMRVSVSNWSTTEADIDRSIEAIVRVVREVAAAARA
jgi:glutamate/tyrosine decarboxylase-like PLP-dependent enzyme